MKQKKRAVKLVFFVSQPSLSLVVNVGLESSFGDIIACHMDVLRRTWKT